VFNGKIYNVILNNRTLSDKEVNNLYVSLPTTYKSSESSYNQEPTFGRLLYVDGAEPKSYYLTGTTFSDISGSNRNGTLTQSTVTQGITTVAGTLPTFNQFNGGHFYFNGFKTADSSNADQKGNSFIRFSPTNLPSSNSPSTIIAWARARSSQSTTVRYIFSYGLFSPAAQTRYVGIQYPNLFSVGAYGTNFGLTFSGLVIDQWFQIAFVYNGTNAFLYVNGELKNARSLSLNTITNLAASSAYIGRNNRSLTVTSDPLDGYFYGDIAQTIVYNRALTEQEIYQHYKTTRDRFGAPEVVRPISVSDIYPPQVTTINPILLNTITTTSAQSGVIINFNGNAQITESGILFRLASQTGLFEYNQPGISFISSSSGQIVNLTGLLISTGYQVRAFAYNGTSFGYGDIIDFTTGSPTALIVLAVTASFTGNYATGFGQVTDLGGAQNYTTRGFVWSNNTINVSTANNLLTRVQEVSPEPPFYTSLSEIWNLRIQQLLPATRYYLRAFAKIQNGDNVYSSNELVFTTYTFATVTITQPSSASDVQGTIAFITGNVTNGGDTPVIQRGIVWSDTNNPPTLELDSETSDGTGTGTFTGTLNGLTSNTVYYLRAYAINTAGIAYSNLIQITTDSSATITTNEMLQVLRTTATASATITDIGGATVTAKGFIWAQTTQFANPNNYTLSNVVGGQQGSVLGQVNTTPSSYTLSLSNLTANRDYFIRAYATNAIGTSYGNVVYFTTLDFGSVTTGSNTDLTTESVTLFGTITSLGGDTSGEYGFYLGTTNPPTQRVVFGDYSGTVPYDFDSIIELLLYGFSSGNTVYYRSFLKTSVPSITVGANGDYWGNVSSFVVPTPISLPTITMGTVSVFSTSNTGRFILETSRNFGFSTDTINTPIQEKGIVYGLKSSVPTPDFNNNKTIGSPSSGNGLFVATSSTLLTAAGIYTIRSYAKILDVQFVYSPVLDFVAHNIQLTVTLNGLNIDVTGDPADNPLYVYTSRGFVWNTTGDPKVENGDTISGPTSQPTTDVAPFTKTSLITNINGNTTYYVRAFVKLSNNPNMFIYSLVKTYPANPLPTVTITPESGWFDTTLSLNSLLFKVNLNIQMNGNTDQENGIVWGTSLNPTTALTTKQSVGSLVYNTTVNIYTPTFTDNTNYYFRGYTTVNGISTYSDNFAVRTIVFTDFTLTIESNYDITADATTPIATGWSIVNRGFIYTTNGQDPFAGNGVTAKTLNTSGFGAFTDTMVLSANDNTTYKARAWVDINITNSNNTVRIYSNMQEVTVSISTQVPSITLGAILDLFVDTISANKATMTAAPSGITQNPTSRGVIWSTTQNPTTSLTTKTSNGNGNSDFTQTIPPSGQNLALNTTYYLRAYAINGAGTAYSVQQTIFTRSVRLLSLTIGNKGRLEYSAEAPDLGNVIGNGVGERGIVWSTSPILIYQQNPSPTAVPNGTGNGLFNGTVIGSPVSGTTYYVRAYVEVEDFSNLIVYSNQRIYTAP
jgi:hypothetical protein